MLKNLRTVAVAGGVPPTGELANANAGIDSPCIEKLVPDLWNNHQFLTTGKGDVALVEQMIDVGRQQQTVSAVEALGIRRVPPRLDVAGLQVSGLINARNA